MSHDMNKPIYGTDVPGKSLHHRLFSEHCLNSWLNVFIKTVWLCCSAKSSWFWGQEIRVEKYSYGLTTCWKKQKACLPTCWLASSTQVTYDIGRNDTDFPRGQSCHWPLLDDTVVFTLWNSHWKSIIVSCSPEGHFSGHLTHHHVSFMTLPVTVLFPPFWIWFTGFLLVLPLQFVQIFCFSATWIIAPSLPDFFQRLCLFLFVSTELVVCCELSRPHANQPIYN